MAISRRMRSARVRKPTTTPSRTTGKRSTSFELIRFATSARVCSSDRHSTERAMASLTGMSRGSAEPRCSWLRVSARNSPLLVRCRKSGIRYLSSSRCVIIPISEPEASTTGVARMSCSTMRRATSPSVWSGPTVNACGVMTSQAFTVGPDQTLGEVARLMVEHDIRATPVVDASGSLIGMITHRELLKYLIPDFLQRTKSGEFRALTRSQLQRGSADPRLIPVKDAMARSVLCLSEEQTLADVANLINSKDVDRFPVVREGVVVGFLTRADLIRRLIAI